MNYQHDTRCFNTGSAEAKIDTNRAIIVARPLFTNAYFSYSLLSGVNLVAVYLFIFVASVSLVSAEEMRGGSNPADSFWRGTKPQILSEKQFKDYLDLSQRLTDMGGLEGIGNYATKFEQIAAIKQKPRFMSLLRERNYTPEAFYDITVNVLLAFGAAQMVDQKSQIEESLAKLDESLGKDVYNKTKADWEARLALVDQVPPINIELAKKYHDVFEALSNQTP